VQQIDASIAFRDTNFAIPGDVVVAASYRGNTDDLAGTSRSDDVECGSPSWTPAGSPALDAAAGWRRLEAAALDHRWLGPDAGSGPKDQFLVSPALQVSAAGSFGFTFRHRYDFESDATPTYYDGGVIEISTDGGTSWTDIGASATPGYDGAVSSCCSNPLAGRAAYGASNATYPAFETVSVNLGTAYQGAAVRVRFRVGADEASGGSGWEIDDIVFTGIANTPFCTLLADRGLCLHPGGVPEAAASGTPLHVDKNSADPALLDLSWGASCGNDVGVYAVYEGVLGSYYNEVPLGCSVPGTTLAGQTPGAGARYYLVAPLASLKNTEGSHGSSTAGERPPSPAACRTMADTQACQ
jgi:hypothetical protein